MRISAIFLLFGTIGMLNGEIRSLRYIYTALSDGGPSQFPSFIAMGLLDHRQIDYFDVRGKTKVWKKQWMRDHLGQDYFDKGTESRSNKMQWFKVNLDILIDRLHQNNSDSHILQWQHGCVVDLQPDGKPHFIKGIDRYSYDEHDFLAYDSGDKKWYSTMNAGLQTKDKWNRVPDLIHYTNNYLMNECTNWLIKFISYEVREDKPELYIFSKKSVKDTNHVLTCLATGLPSQHITLKLRRNGRVLETSDGLEEHDFLPNHDETFQKRVYVEVSRTDKSSFSCHVSELKLDTEWDGKLPSENSNIGIVVGAVIALLIVVALMAGVAVYLKRRTPGERVMIKDPCEKRVFIEDVPPNVEPDEEVPCLDLKEIVDETDQHKEPIDEGYPGVSDKSSVGSSSASMSSENGSHHSSTDSGTGK